MNSILVNNECYSIKQLAINGDDLVKLGYRPGKNIGYILTDLLQLSIEDNSFNNKETLLNYVLKNYIDKERIYI
jgi:tRNA nucleotidyltransferase (CCA-adding enzyme)